MVKKKFLLFGMFLVFGIMFFGSVFASSYAYSNPQLLAPGASKTSTIMGRESFQGRDLCQQGQDFILQVAPGGCSPPLVRSDLLEEQNVPVYCPISAIKINPLVDIDAIKYLRFPKREYSEGVAGVYFFPSRAALGLNEKITTPVENNIGYAQIILKRNPVETDMPEFVEGNITARIQYDIKNAFGLGDASFYLKPMTDEEWDEDFERYGFWKFKGYLRASEVRDDRANIVLYSGNTIATSEKSYQRRISSVNLEEGQTSNEIYLPTFDYCLGGLKLRLDKVVDPDTTARFMVDEEYVEVFEGETFLDGRCRVGNVEYQGINQKASIVCNEDGKLLSTRTDLKIVPELELKIDNENKSVKVGDFLYSYENDKKKDRFVYLGYAFSLGDTNELSDLRVVLVSSPDNYGERLSESEISEVKFFAKNFYSEQEVSSSVGNNIIRSITSGSRKASGLATWLYDVVVDGDVPVKLDYQESDTIGNKRVEFAGFKGARDIQIVKENDDYQNAKKDFDTLIGGFSNLIENDSQISYGEVALHEKIQLASKTGQKRTMSILCQEFLEEYPDSSLSSASDCTNKIKSANTENAETKMVINDELVEIELKGVYEPSIDDYNADIKVTFPDGSFEKYERVGKNSIRILEEDKDHSFVLKELDQDSAKIDVRLKSERESGDVVYTTDSLNLRRGDSVSYGGYIFELDDVTLNQFAKVSVLPEINKQETEANFSFKVGIEKRAIQLAPDKIKEKIERVDKRIQTWEAISSGLEKTVKGLKAACIGTGGFLTAKNLIENTQGKGIARKEVMRGDHGWYNICQDMINEDQYSSLEECLIEKSDEIDRDVQLTEKIITKQNEEIKEFQKDYVVDVEREGFAKLIGEKTINDSGLTKNYLNKIQGKISNEYADSFSEGGFEKGHYDFEDLKKIELYESILNEGPSPEMEIIAKNKLDEIYSEVSEKSEADSEKKTFATDYGKNVDPDDVIFYTPDADARGFPYKGYTLSKNTNIEASSLSGVRSDQPVAFLQASTGEQLILILDDSGSSNKLPILRDSNNVPLVWNSNSNSIYSGLSKSFEERTVEYDIKNGRIYFYKLDKDSYENEFQASFGEGEPVARYFESGTNKELPSLVPFDLKNGWYIAVESNLPTTSQTRTYDLSGRPNSFKLCNVGEDGIEHFQANPSEDICQLINLNIEQTYTKFYGLDSGEVKELIDLAINAFYEASTQYEDAKDRGYVLIPGINEKGKKDRIKIKVGAPAADVSDYRCEDFMSPKECNLIFNLCDPVLCPKSRCDFGGQYPVHDVIQTGIIGGLTLCLPNAQEGIKVPICLTGISAGVDGWTQIQKDYRDCLQTSLDTGETVGICDYTQSIYICEFFWRQAQPLLKVTVPKLVSRFVFGEGTRGGGEYASFKQTLEDANNAANYFTQTYALNSYKAFQARSAGNIGSAVCKNYASLSVPEGETLLDAITDPDSPIQFHGKFSETPFSSTTVPPTSHYKVFYHIYSGKDTGAYYQIYMRKGAESSYYQDTNFLLNVDSGYVPRGESITETWDRTAPSGYTELCINVNGQEECGFKQVSTSFAVDYVEDSYLREQALKRDITEESECVSGSTSAYSLLQPNMQDSAQELIDPAIYEKGITRICASKNPGIGTDDVTETENSRWVEVGVCGDENIKCWLDRNSVKDVINSPDLATYFETGGIKNGTVTNLQDTTLDEISEKYNKFLEESGEYWSEAEFQNAVNKIDDEGNKRKIIDLATKALEKVIFSKHKAKLYLLRGRAYVPFAVDAYGDYLESLKTSQEKAEEEYEKREIIDQEKEFGEELMKTKDIVIEFDKGDITPNSFFRYYAGEWYFGYEHPEGGPTSEDKLVWRKAKDYDSSKQSIWGWKYSDKETLSYVVENYGNNSYSYRIIQVVDKLKEDFFDYGKGLSILAEGIDKEAKFDEDAKLIAKNNNVQVVYYSEIFEVVRDSKVFRFKREEDKWFFGLEVEEEGESIVSPTTGTSYTPSTKRFDYWEIQKFSGNTDLSVQNLILSLEGEDFVEGSKLIFNEAAIEKSFLDVGEYQTLEGARISGISEKQLNNVDPILIQFINCMNEGYQRLEGKPLTITSLTDDNLYDGGCQLEEKEESYNDKENCVHSSTSCHYCGGSKLGEVKTRAVDFRTRNDETGSYDFSTMLSVYNSCYSAFQKRAEDFCANYYDERKTNSPHLHMSINCECGDFTGDNKCGEYSKLKKTSSESKKAYTEKELEEKGFKEKEIEVILSGDCNKCGESGLALWRNWRCDEEECLAIVDSQGNEICKYVNGKCVEIIEEKKYPSSKFITSYKKEEISKNFEKYSFENKPQDLSEIEFRSLLVAISQQETGVGTAGNICGAKNSDSCTDWVMGYTKGPEYPESYMGVEPQIRLSSKLLGSALDGKSTLYNECNTKSGISKIKCVLSIYRSGSPTSKVGKEYADQVVDFSQKWRNYFENSV